MFVIFFSSQVCFNAGCLSVWFSQRHLNPLEYRFSGHLNLNTCYGKCLLSYFYTASIQFIFGHVMLIFVEWVLESLLSLMSLMLMIISLCNLPSNMLSWPSHCYVQLIVVTLIYFVLMTLKSIDLQNLIGGIHQVRKDKEDHDKWIPS